MGVRSDGRQHQLRCDVIAVEGEEEGGEGGEESVEDLYSGLSRDADNGLQ